MKKQKWDELNNLNLHGFDCYCKETNKKNKTIYYFHKQTKEGWLDIKSEFDNIEFCLQHLLTLK